ncbi:MAG: Gfo/Idh/MocA family oxidoreductase [Ruminococcaceae bacterium]|nr:Gfo/Idh/MocA family oxidoreductase [Oscillospiraceae bacterium]
MTRLNSSTVDCLSDKKATLEAKRQDILDTYNAPETSAVDKLKLGEQLKGVNERIGALESKIMKLARPETHYEEQTNDQLDASMVLTGDKLGEMVQNGSIGEIKRTNWIITDWYRTQQYYNSGGWRATWKGEGGGVLYNQAPHQLDLFQWIVGMMPTKVHAFCHYGKWHDIEVEDDVTCYVEYPNGATGVFITTTADAPGTNRFEITGTKGTLIFEDNKLFYKQLTVDEREWCATCEEGFKKPECLPTVQVELEGENTQHTGICNNIANAILGLEEVYAPAKDGIHGVHLANAMHLSSWLGESVTLPIDDELFYEELKKRIAISKPHEVNEKTEIQG